MTTYRIRASRDSPVTGAYDWAALDDNGAVLDSGSAPLRAPPARSECELLLACDLVLLSTITVSGAQQRKLAASLRFLVEHETIPDPERLHVAAVRTEAKDVLQVGVVDRQWMQQMLDRLQRSGLVVRAAYPECLLPELPGKAWTLVWNGDESFLRTGEFGGFPLDLPGEGEAPAALRLALGAAAATGSMPERIVLRTPAGAELPRINSWSALLDVPIERGPDWHWASLGRPGLNLLQGEFAPRGTELGWKRSMRVSAFLAGALAVLTFAGAALDWTVKVRERDRLSAQMQQIFRDSFGEGSVVVDAPLQMRRNLTQLRRQAGLPVADDFLVLLAPVADRLLDPAKVRLESIAYGNGSLTLTVRPTDVSQFNALIGELRAKLPIQGLSVGVEPAGAPGAISVRAAPGPGRER